MIAGPLLVYVNRSYVLVLLPVARVVGGTALPLKSEGTIIFGDALL